MPFETQMAEGVPSRQRAVLLDTISLIQVVRESAVTTRAINIRIRITLFSTICAELVSYALSTVKVQNCWIQEFLGNPPKNKFLILYKYKPQKMSIKLLLLLFFLNCSLQAINCSNSYSFDYSTCTFNVQNPQNTCDSFNFINCTWQECDAWFFNGKVSFCMRYVDRYSSNWDTCTGVCCESEDRYPQTWDTIQICQDQIIGSNSKKKMILFIVLGVGGGFAVLVVALVMVIRCYRQRVAEEQRPDQSANNTIMLRRWGHPGSHHRQASKNQQVFQNIESVSHDRWVDVPLLPQKLQQSCSVCLQTKVCLQLQCGHCYHRKCIVQCINRKLECILCRSVNINRIKVYCQSCVRCYYQSTLMDHLKQLSMGVVMCPKCVEEGEIKQI